MNDLNRFTLALFGFVFVFIYFLFVQCRVKVCDLLSLIVIDMSWTSKRHFLKKIYILLQVAAPGGAKKERYEEIKKERNKERKKEEGCEGLCFS